jgi:hypothetical protein
MGRQRSLEWLMHAVHCRGRITAGASGPLDAFVSGEISVEELGPALSALCESSPDDAWEVLALLDQYHRRRLLTADHFRAIKARINRIALMQPPGDIAQEIKADDRRKRQDRIEDAVKPREQPGPVMPGRVLNGRYVIEGVLGRGGKATVFRALDRERADLPEHSQYVAVKVLNPEWSHRPEVITAFRSGFYQAQRLSHPGIINVFDLGCDVDTHFFTMELLEGEVLGRLLERIQPRLLARPQALTIIREVGLALACAHERGIVHGNLKPGHVMILRNGEVRVLDFGGARAGDDVFGLCCLAYELLAGTPPYRCQPARLEGRQKRRPRRISGLSRRQWRTLSAGLAADSEDEPYTLRELLSGLDLDQAAPRLPALDALDTQPAARGRVLLPAVLATLSVLLLAAAFVMRDDLVRMLAPPGSSTPLTERAAEQLPGSDAAAASETNVEPDMATAAPPGSGEIGFAQDTYVVNPGDGAARLVLQRAGGLAGDVAFSWWTEDGTAREGEDFISPGSRSERLRNGEGQVIIFVPVVSDPLRRGSKVFYVQLGDTRGGLRRGEISRAAVIISAAID